METHSNFHPAGEVVADERSRIAFGKTGVRKDDRYAVAVNDDGEILLTPLATGSPPGSPRLGERAAAREPRARVAAERCRRPGGLRLVRVLHQDQDDKD